MESAVNSYNSNIDVKTPKVTITPLSNIRSEMKLFSAVFTLADCRLREQLLNPLEHIHATPTNDHKKFVYNGYVSNLVFTNEILLNDIYKYWFHVFLSNRKH